VGRTKGYDRDVVAEQAMHAFWSVGYASTTARQLADATGVNVSTLYAEFGNKEGLYLAAIGFYEREMVTRYIGALEQPDASIATVRQVLLQYPEFARADDGAPGCLLCNAAIEQAPTPEASRASTARYVERITAGITNALAHEREKGSTATDGELAAFGHYLAAVLLGLFVMVRARVKVDILEDAVKQAIADLDALVLNGSASRPT